MKAVINIVLVLLIALLAYMLYNSIKEPIAFEAVKEYRKEVVVDRLEEIRTSQEMYRDMKGKFAGSFDSLVYALRNDSIPIPVIEEDPEDPANEELWVRSVIYYSAMDSVKAKGINLDSLHIVPFSDGKTFSIQADTLTYQSTLTNVVEVGTRWKDFMGKYGSKKYTKYDNMYNPDAAMKFGDMYKPTLSGNWN